jgi:GNAT superfamily N-acetyltransferase
MYANRHTAALLAELEKSGPMEHWLDELRDGTHVLVRPVSADDNSRLLRFFRHLSPLSLRFRFLGAVTPIDDNLIDSLLSGPGQGYVALIHSYGELQVIGITRYRPSADAHDCCECAVAVADPWQRKHLGRLLLGHLIDTARQRGFKTMRSTDLSTDYPIHRLYKRFGFTSMYLKDGFDRIVHDLEL